MKHTTHLAAPDSLRAIAAVAVVALHTQPFASVSAPDDTTRAIAFIINNLSRFAVPAFFIISGYFLGVSATHRSVNAAIRRALSRLIQVFLFWSLVYGLIPKPKLFILHGIQALPIKWHTTLSTIMAEPTDFLRHGTTWHLWFFPALISAVLIIWGLSALRRERALLWVGLVLYVAGLLGQSYRVLPVGVDIHMHIMRDGPFFSTLLVGMGYLAARQGMPQGNPWAYILAGTALQFGEMLTLGALFGAPQGDYFFGNAIQALGLLRLVTTNPDLGKTTPLPRLGRLTLGVYASHILVLQYADYLDNVIPELPWQFAFTAIVWAGAVLVSLGLSRTPLRRMVT